MKSILRAILKANLVILLICTVLVNVHSQINNGSFETTDSLPDINGWSTTCPFSLATFVDAALGGGVWCAILNSGNTQGCFPGYAYQLIPSAKDGDIWKLEGWARVDNLLPPNGSIGIYFGVVDNAGNVSTLTGGTTTATDWTFISVEDTISLAAGDTAAVVLDAGLVGGFALGFAYFDLISAQKTGTVSSIFSPEPDALSSTAFPNPFSSSTTLKFENDAREAYELLLYNSKGQLLRSFDNIVAGHVVIERGELPSGLYFYQLRLDRQARSSGVLLVE